MSCSEKDLYRSLQDLRTEILAEWRERILSGYPDQTARLWRSRTDPFRNPVGASIKKGTEEILDALIAKAGAEELACRLDGLVRVRAVQDIAPSLAVSFVFDLKDVIRKVVGEKTLRIEDLAEFERRVDELGLVAFDIYTECRDKIREIRVREARNQVFKLIERVAAPRDGSRERPGLAGERVSS